MLKKLPVVPQFSTGWLFQLIRGGAKLEDLKGQRVKVTLKKEESMLTDPKPRPEEEEDDELAEEPEEDEEEDSDD